MRDLRSDGINLVHRELVQTFVDNTIIESVQDIERVWHTPVRKQEDPLITEEMPWEHALWCGLFRATTVLRDPEDRLFKCWYQDQDGRPGKGIAPGRNHANFNMRSRQLYAESEDGIHWRKPELDVYEVDGSKTNVVLGGGDFGDAHHMSVVLDPHPPSKEERFRAIFVHLWPDEAGIASGNSRLECAHSPDGIHWTIYPEAPRGAHLPSVFYDHAARQFVANGRYGAMASAPVLNPRTPLTGSFLKPHEPNRQLADATRRIWQYRSSDFIHWGDPILVAAVDDEEDNLDEQFYGMAQYKLGGAHLATISVLHGVRDEKDVQLLVSRDGIRWNRTNKRQPFLAPRGDGHWDAHVVSLPCPPIDVGDEHWFYYGGQNYRHDWWLCGQNEGLDHPEAYNPDGFSAGLGLAVLRKEGYASLSAGEVRDGVVVTQPLYGAGEKLQINATCREGGSIQAEVVDRFDTIIGGCTRERCDAFTGDEIRHTMTWEGKSGVPGDQRKVRFFLRNAEIYSFRFIQAGQEDDETLW